MDIEKFTISKRSTYTVLAITCIVLLIPFTAMFFTQEVNWGVLDFAVTGGLLFFFGYVHQVLTAGSKSLAMHVLIGGVVFALLLLVWSQLI